MNVALTFAYGATLVEGCVFSALVGWAVETIWPSAVQSTSSMHTARRKSVPPFLVAGVIGHIPFVAELEHRGVHRGGRARRHDYALVLPWAERAVGSGVLDASLIVRFHAGGRARTGLTAVVRVVIGIALTEHPRRLEESLRAVRVAVRVLHGVGGSAWCHHPWFPPRWRGCRLWRPSSS